MADNFPDHLDSGTPTIDSSAYPDHLYSGSSIVQQPDWSGRASLPYQAPSWKDYGAIAAESFSHTAAGLYDAAGRPDKGEQWRQTAKDWGDSVSPDARANYEANLGSKRWQEHPFSQFALNAVSQAPQLAAIGGAEAIGGPFAAGGMGALVYGAGAADAFSEAVDNASDVQLGPRFQQLVDSGMSGQDARNQIKNETLWQSGVPEVAGLLGASVGVLGPVGQIARGPVAGTGIRNMVGRMGVSGVEAGLVAGGQDLGTNLALNHAYGMLGLPQTSPEDIATSAGKQALEMGALGALGGLHRGEDKRLPWKKPVVEAGPLQLSGPGDQLRLEPPRLQLPAPTRLLPKPGWQAPEVGEGIATPTDMYAYPTGEEGAFRTGEGMPMGAPDIPALPKPAWTPPEVGEGVGRPRPGPFGRPQPIEMPETQGNRVDALYDQIQEIRDLNRQAREGGGGGPSPTADKSMEPSQTPSAPLKSAQAAPMMPDKETLITDAAKKGQAQDRHDTPVSGQAAPIRSGRVGRTKPAAGRDFGPTEEAEDGQAASLPSSIADDAHVEALKAAFEQEQRGTEESTIDQDQLKPETRERLGQQFTPEQQQQLAENLRQSGRGGIADMLQPRGREEPPPAEPPPEPPPRPTPPPSSPSTGSEGIPFMITRAMKAQLKERGFTDDQIMNMTPAQAHSHLQEPIVHTPPPPSSEEGLFPPPTPAPPRRTPAPVYSDVLDRTEQAFRGEGRTEPIQDVVHTGREPTAEEIAAAEKEEGYKPTKAGHVPKWKVDARERNNKLADEVVGSHPIGARDALALLEDSRGGKGALAPLRARVNAMLDEAKKKGVEIPKEFTKLAEGGVDHSPSVLLLNEAQRFLKHIEGKLDEEKRIKAVEKFLMREKDLREGRYEDVLAERGKEAEAALAKKKAIPGRGEKAIEAEKLETVAEESQLSKVTPQHIKTPEEELIRKQRLKAAEKVLREKVQRWADAQKKGIKGVADIKDMARLKAEAEKALEDARELGLDVPKTYRMAKASDFQRFLDHLQTVGEQPTGEDETVTVVDNREGAVEGATAEVKPLRTTNVRDILLNINYAQYHPAFRGMMKILAKKLSNLVGDVPVHIYDTKEWLKFEDKDAYGSYASGWANHINIHQDYVEGHTPLHEAFHAATVYAYENFPEFKTLIDRLYNEIGSSPRGKITQLTAYAFSHPLEMLTEMMSNPDVQKAFKDVLVSPEFAKELGLKDWSGASIFKKVLDKLRDLLGLEPKYYSAMEAAASIGERMTQRQFPEERARYEHRLWKTAREAEPTIDSQPEIYKHSKVTENLKQGYDDIRDRIKYEPTSARLNLKRWFDTPREWGIQMEGKGHFKGEKGKPGPFRQWLEHMSQQGYERTQFLKRYLDVAKSIATLGVKKPQEFTKLVDLLLSAARNGAHPDDELFKGKNDFLKLTNPNHWEAIAGHPGDRKKYMELSPETQKIFRDIRDKMTEIHKSDLEAARKSLVDNYRKYANKQSPEFRKAFEKVAKDEEFTPLEEAAFGDDPYIQDIHTYNRAISSDAGKMFYFPMKRTAWKYAITGSHEYAKPKGVENSKDDPHRFIFGDNPSAAYKFTRDVGLPSYREVRYYFDKDENGKPMAKEYTGRRDVRQIAGENVNPKREFHVVVDPEHTEFANSKTEGERIREAMGKAGVKNISGVMPVKGQALKHYGFYGPQIEAMVNRVGKLEHLNARERKAAQDAIEHTAIASMRGNYLPQSLLPRRRIMGTDNIDIIKSFWDRVRASANFQTMANHRSGIDDNLKQMEEEVRSKRTHADATELNSFYNMIEDRTMNFATDDLNDMNMSTLMHHIQSFGVIKYLASPAFLAYHQLHVPLVVIPALSKHVGFLKASKMALDAYKQMSGGLPIVGKGIKGGFERAWNYDKQPTDFIDALMNELEKHGGTKDELAAMKWAVENDIMHHTGINFSSYFKGMGQMERFEQRAMGVSAEIIGAADAVNRFNSMLMFYRAAKSKGMEGEEAFRWAGDRVAETQGQFTAFNRVGLMQHPNMRAVLQFKSFPLILMKTVTKAFYNSLRWDASREERVDGLKTLLGLTAASMALSGVQGAVPEPIEDIANIASALGLIDSWDQYEDELRGYVADNMGSDVATLVMNGVVGGGLGTDLTHRGGISDLTGFARLHVTKSQDLENALFKWMSGVPGSVLGDGIDGMNAMETGDVPGMLKGFLPRIITDPVKAYQDYNQGVTTRAGKVITPPLGLPDTLKQALGLTPLTASLAREARYVSGEEKGVQQTQRTKIEQMYAKGDKGYAIRAMNDYNRANPDNPIRLGDLKKATKEATRKKVFGMDIPKQKLQAQELEHRREAYGLQPQ